MGYITLAVWGVPNTLERGTRSQVLHMWADWLHHPCLMGGPQRFGTGNKIKRAPHGGELATLPSPNGGGGGNTSKRGTRSQVLHMSAEWLHHPWRMGGSQHFKAVNKITSAPHVGGLATSPVPGGGSLMLLSGEQDHKCATCGRIGYITPA